MSKNYYVSGEFNVICDRCGAKKKAHEIKHEWTGLMVCSGCYEQRQPQDFVRARQDKISIPFSRPRPPDVFVDGVICDNFTRTCAADVGVADCAQVDYIGDFVCRTFYSPTDVEDGTGIVGISVVGYGIVGESTYTTVICAPSYYELDDIAKSVSGVAVAGFAVSGTPISLSPSL